MMLTIKAMYQEVIEEKPKMMDFCESCGKHLDNEKLIVYYDDFAFCHHNKNYECFDKFAISEFSNQLDNYFQ